MNEDKRVDILASITVNQVTLVLYRKTVESRRELWLDLVGGDYRINIAVDPEQIESFGRTVESLTHLVRMKDLK